MPKKSKAKRKTKKISSKKITKPKGMTTGRKFGIAGILSAIVGLFFLPIVFGILAIVLGVIAVKKQERKLGSIAIIFGGIVLIILFFALMMLS